MNRKPNIAIVAGGDSSEFEISVKSADNIFDAIDRDKFTPWLVIIKGPDWNIVRDNETIAEIDKSDFSFTLAGKKTSFDYAYITIHGTPGEDGILQGYFELLRIPYSTCNVHSSALTFNKWFCSNYLRGFGIKMAKALILNKNEKADEDLITGNLGLPLFVKPNAGGSSFGITKVKDAGELKPALKKAWNESKEAIIEEFIEGREYTCGLVKLSNENLIFPVTEVIPKNEFFDFEAKYTPGATDEITPARLPGHLFEKCQQLSSKIYDLCQCSGIVRIDYILKNEEFYFLEVNTTPGMTATSFIPQQIKAMGLTLKQLLSKIILNQL
ncbi:MAG: D-alanine--D-alanine ligase [Prolixibacteraceae bacterium]|jgi:D-alanine-D-alanine ligase|nr:D-alanine--D-alanine ligase [Prolixibacteraceae bacterium]NLO03709.1 D-alanine--D-alanine ligase [Bacteroidales bacterium]